MKRAARLAERGRVQEAVATLDAAIAHGADPYTCYLQQSRIYQAERQWVEAMHAARKAVDENPAAVSAREAVIALLLETQDYHGAVDASKALIRIAPRYLPARDALGAAYVGLGDVPSAVRVANDMIRIDPNGAPHHFKKGLLCEYQGQNSLAIEEFARVADMAADPDLRHSAEEHLQALESTQASDIVALAVDDVVFRTALLQDAREAAMSRGFNMSETGWDALEDLVETFLAEIPPEWRPNLYH